MIMSDFYETESKKLYAVVLYKDVEGIRGFECQKIVQIDGIVPLDILIPLARKGFPNVKATHSNLYYEHLWCQLSYKAKMVATVNNRGGFRLLAYTTNGVNQMFNKKEVMKYVATHRRESCCSY